jgi:hypothetical protein
MHGLKLYLRLSHMNRKHETNNGSVRTDTYPRQIKKVRGDWENSGSRKKMHNREETLVWYLPEESHDEP